LNEELIAALEVQVQQMQQQIAAVKQNGHGGGPQTPVVSGIKLDLGCGPHKKEGFVGIDIRKFDGVDHVFDMSRDPWPFADNSVEEAYSAHSLEHIPSKEVEWELETVQIPIIGERQRLVKKITYPRAHFFNELWRVMKPGAKATIITPHWCSPRATGDMTHEWPPVSEWLWLYLDKTWRPQNAPHDDFITCDFTYTLGYSRTGWLQAEIAGRNPEFVQKKQEEALTKFKGAADDMLTTLTARK
jgi:hypothetical protein